MSLVVAVDQRRAESCLGASEAAGVLGLDKYNPPIKVWRRHRGLDVNDDLPPHVREAAEWGSLHEPIVRGKYAQMTRRTVGVPDASTIRSGWLRATPDGLVWNESDWESGEVFDGDWWPTTGDRSSRHPDGLLQCKTASEYLDHAWSDGPPPKYEVQCRVEMAVTDLPWCDILCLVGGNRLRGPFRVERDQAIEDRILTDLRAFWSMVERGIEPTVDDTDAWKLHVSEKMRETKAVMLADAATSEVLVELRTRRAALIEANAKVKEATNSVLLRMSAAQVQAIVDPTLGRFSAYRSGAGMDWKGYAESLERAMIRDGALTDTAGREMYRRPSTSWSIRVPRGLNGDHDE